jgi:hypothetical protein
MSHRHLTSTPFWVRDKHLTLKRLCHFSFKYWPQYALWHLQIISIPEQEKERKEKKMSLSFSFSFSPWVHSCELDRSSSSPGTFKSSDQSRKAKKTPRLSLPIWKQDQSALATCVILELKVFYRDKIWSQDELMFLAGTFHKMCLLLSRRQNWGKQSSILSVD